MLRKIGLLLVCIMLLSCQNKKGNTKQDFSKILNPTQMTDVLVDIYLIEAALGNSNQDPANIKQFQNHYYTYLYKKHHVNHRQILSSMQYYCFHTKELSQIYIDVINHLTALQTTTPSAEE
ncbi:MAG: DUF4296 domain-containing protein [Bacteroidales bacterium]